MRWRGEHAKGLVAVAFVASVLVGCGDGAGGSGDDAAGPSTTGGAGGAGAGGEGPGGPGAGGGDAGGGGDAPEWEGEPLPTRIGAVSIRTLPDADGPEPEYGAATAYFFDYDGSTGCSRIVDGPCAVYRCMPPDPITGTEAGVITVTGTTPPVTLEPDAVGQADPSYTKVQSEAPLWAEGDVVTVSAAGGVVPAFEATLVAPTRATITTPDLAQDVVVTRAAGLDLAWSAEGQGGVLAVSIGVPGDVAYQLVCGFPIDDGAATIPAAMLAHLPAGTDARIGFSNRADEIVDAGGFEVTVELVSLAHAEGAPLGLAATELTLE